VSHLDSLSRHRVSRSLSLQSLNRQTNITTKSSIKVNFRVNVVVHRPKQEQVLLCPTHRTAAMGVKTHHAGIPALRMLPSDIVALRMDGGIWAVRVKECRCCTTRRHVHV